MKHVLYSEEYIYYLQLKRYKCLSKLGRVLTLTYNRNRYTKKVYDFPEGR